MNKSVAISYAMHMEDIGNNSTVRRKRRRLDDKDCICCMEISDAQLECGCSFCTNCLRISRVKECPHCHIKFNSYYVNR